MPKIASQTEHKLTTSLNLRSSSGKASRYASETLWERRARLVNFLEDHEEFTPEIDYRPGRNYGLFAIIAVLALLSMQGVTAAIGDLDAHVVRAHTFDTGNISGSTSIDVSGNMNYTLSGSPTTGTMGLAGEALSLDGTSQYVDTGELFAMGSATDQTISLFFKMDAVDRNNALWGWLWGSGSSLNYVSVRADNNKIEGKYRQGGGTLYGSEYTVLSAATWYHVVLVQSGTSFEMYLDGTSVGTGTLPTITSDTRNAYIGAVQGSSGALSLFDGLIDEFYLFNKSLNSTEVSELYEAVATNGSQYPFSTSGGGETSLTLTVNSPTNKTYKYSNVEFNVTTNQNATIKYEYNGSNTTICTDCTAGTASFLKADGAYSVKFWTDNGTVTNTSTVNFTIDAFRNSEHGSDATCENCTQYVLGAYTVYDDRIVPPSNGRSHHADLDYFNGTWYMAYHEMDGSANSQHCVATSTNGLNYTKQGCFMSEANSTPSWGSDYLERPSMAYDADLDRWIYIAGTKDGSDYDIGVMWNDNWTGTGLWTNANWETNCTNPIITALPGGEANAGDVNLRVLPDHPSGFKYWLRTGINEVGNDRYYWYYTNDLCNWTEANSGSPAYIFNDNNLWPGGWDQTSQGDYVGVWSNSDGSTGTAFGFLTNSTTLNGSWSAPNSSYKLIPNNILASGDDINQASAYAVKRVGTMWYVPYEARDYTTSISEGVYHDITLATFYEDAVLTADRFSNGNYSWRLTSANLTKSTDNYTLTLNQTGSVTFEYRTASTENGLGGESWTTKTNGSTVESLGYYQYRASGTGDREDFQSVALTTAVIANETVTATINEWSLLGRYFVDAGASLDLVLEANLSATNPASGEANVFIDLPVNLSTTGLTWFTGDVVNRTYYTNESSLDAADGTNFTWGNRNTFVVNITNVPSENYTYVLDIEYDQNFSFISSNMLLVSINDRDYTKNTAKAWETPNWITFPLNNSHVVFEPGETFPFVEGENNVTIGYVCTAEVCSSAIRNMSADLLVLREFGSEVVTINNTNGNTTRFRKTLSGSASVSGIARMNAPAAFTLSQTETATNDTYTNVLNATSLLSTSIGQHIPAGTIFYRMTVPENFADGTASVQWYNETAEAYQAISVTQYFIDTDSDGTTDYFAFYQPDQLSSETYRVTATCVDCDGSDEVGDEGGSSGSGGGGSVTLEPVVRVVQPSSGKLSGLFCPVDGASGSFQVTLENVGTSLASVDLALDGVECELSVDSLSISPSGFASFTVEGCSCPDAYGQSIDGSIVVTSGSSVLERIEVSLSSLRLDARTWVLIGFAGFLLLSIVAVLLSLTRTRK